LRHSAFLPFSSPFEIGIHLPCQFFNQLQACIAICTVAKTIGNRSGRRKITLFITDISANYNFILS
jgi:hypothetical protein